MEKPKYSTETFVRIYDDRNGSFVEIGPDRDGLDLVEICQKDSPREKCDIRFVTMGSEQAILMAQAVLRLYGPKE